MENTAKETSDGNLVINSGEKSEEDEDDKSLDDLHPPTLVSGIHQSSGHVSFESTVPGTLVPETRVPGFSASGPSSSTDTNTPENVFCPNSTEQSCEINLGLNILPDSLMHGVRERVKRKLPGNQYEAKARKRQKTYHYKNTLLVGGKKRKITDHTDHVRKHLKTIHEESAAEDEPVVSEIIHEHKNKSRSNSDNTASCSESTVQSGETSCTSAEDHEDSEEVQPCSRFCVCQAGPSKLPLEIERRFDIPEPLYRMCLLRRMYSLSNTQYVCCKNRCVKKHSREKMMQKCLFHMNEDYYRSDMSVHEYSWGVWKE